MTRLMFTGRLNVLYGRVYVFCGRVDVPSIATLRTLYPPYNYRFDQKVKSRLRLTMAESGELSSVVAVIVRDSKAF